MMHVSKHRLDQWARVLAAVSLFMVLPVGLTLWARTDPVYVFNGVSYVFPASQGAASTALSNDGTGALSWVSVQVADVVTFATGGSCPSGWSEYTAARGRYLVGLPSGGASGATVGTALTNLESRPVGQHTHSVTDPGHTHTQDAHSHTVIDPGHTHTYLNFTTPASFRDLFGPVVSARVISGTAAVANAASGITFDSATAVNVASVTGVSVGSSGSVLGPNAPYLQLVVCRSVGGS